MRHETERNSREGHNMDRIAFVVYLHITLFVLILELGCATDRGTEMPAATAPGDIIIAGIFPIHEDVAKENNSFEPYIQPCIR